MIRKNVNFYLKNNNKKQQKTETLPWLRQLHEMRFLTKFSPQMRPKIDKRLDTPVLES